MVGGWVGWSHGILGKRVDDVAGIVVLLLGVWVVLLLLVVWVVTVVLLVPLVWRWSLI